MMPFYLHFTPSANALSRSFTNSSLRILTPSSCQVFSSFSLVKSMFLFFMRLNLLFTFLVTSDESFLLSFCNVYISWKQVFIFSLFSNLFFVSCWKVSFKRIIFFLKKIWHLGALLFLILIFSQLFFFDPCKGPLYLLVVGINSW